MLSDFSEVEKAFSNSIISSLQEMRALLDIVHRPSLTTTMKLLEDFDETDTEL
jgi:hypothetical protein